MCKGASGDPGSSNPHWPARESGEAVQDHPGQTDTISPVVHLSAGAYRCTQERWCCTEKGRTANSGSSSGCSRTPSTWLSNPGRVWRPAGLHWCCSAPDTRFPGSKTSGAADRKATYPRVSTFTGENWSYLGETPVNPHPPKPGWKLQKQKTAALKRGELTAWCFGGKRKLFRHKITFRIPPSRDENQLLNTRELKWSMKYFQPILNTMLTAQSGEGPSRSACSHFRMIKSLQNQSCYQCSGRTVQDVPEQNRGTENTSVTPAQG